MKNKDSKLTIGLIIENVYTEFARDVVHSIVSSVPKNKDVEIASHTPQDEQYLAFK